MTKPKILPVAYTLLFLLFCVTVILIKRYSNNQDSLISPAINEESREKVTKHPKFYSDVSGHFLPIPEPKPGDWLAHHNEPGQTLKEFRACKKNIPDSTRNTIYLQPLWIDEKNDLPSLDALQEFTELYFSKPVIVAETMNPSKEEFGRRINNGTGKEQVHAGLILEYLLNHIPEDAFCLQAITKVDLYPDPSWNYVFGYATYTERVGVFSFARYDPAFFKEGRPEDYPRIIFLRSCKIIAHETQHMFGLAHCIFHHCQMNGSNNLNESDAQPIHICPVCHSKLQSSIGFQEEKRYKNLMRFYKAKGFNNEAEWVEKRLSIIK